MRRRTALAALALPFWPRRLNAQEVTQRFGGLTVAVETTFAQPGGIAVVRFRSRWFASTYAIFEGRRAPVFAAAGGPRALVPIPVATPPGSGLLGIELYARNGVQRLRMDFPIGERSFGGRAQILPDEKRALLNQPNPWRDGRRLMQALRTFTNEARWRGPIQPPVVSSAIETFGEHESYGGPPVLTMMDGGSGDQNRGLDYPLAAGTMIQAPAAGTVVMAEPLLLTGNTVVIDHGQGLVSRYCHLSAIDVRPNDRVDARSRLGLAGDTGLALFPQVHWSVYLHGIPVDPSVVVKAIA